MTPVARMGWGECCLRALQKWEAHLRSLLVLAAADAEEQRAARRVIRRRRVRSGRGRRYTDSARCRHPWLDHHGSGADGHGDKGAWVRSCCTTSGVEGR